MVNDFLSQLRNVIQEHIADEMFGVSELANEIGMSRSNLLRKIRKLTNASASQFIRQVRLQEAMEMLKKTSLTVSEVSYKVGFGSTSYFIKCFREEYGYPPGEVGKRTQGGIDYPGVKDQTHQLAAIMFTDIEGYTALMQQDEAKAIANRNRHREVFNSTTEKYNGKILQYYGDGTLSTFHSAIDAVRCAIDMQRAFGEETPIPVRIGIHTGDILFSEDGIIGDGVNVASRIESLASAQSVFISDKVYDEVKNQTGIQTASMGFFELKNVDKPMEVYAISNAGLTVPDKSLVSGKVKVETKSEHKATGVIKRKVGLLWVLMPVLVAILGYFLLTTDMLKGTSQSAVSPPDLDGKKSIAVLPFINDSNDSTNVHFINGLMESTLNNLQKIKELRVISRTSVEKYRNSAKTIPEIARELGVQYLIEGSGQKIGDQVMLHIQLIEAGKDQHIWGGEYNRKADNIFSLQREIADNIIERIQVIITPEEKELIEKVPTENVQAYDHFLKGLDLLKERSNKSINEALSYFEKAIEEDGKFARAYAAIAMSYYYLDENQAEKKYGEQINHFADQALLFDEKLPQSLIAKALFYMHAEQYELAVSYFEKALEYNPNYDLVYAFLVDLYVHHLPNSKKYLEYALQGIKIDVAAYDSVTTSFNYLHISNAFIQSGFVHEARLYIDKSLAYYPGNLYSAYVKAFISYAENRNLGQTKTLLIDALKKDTTRFDIIQEVAKISYFMRDYESAYQYYMKYLAYKEALNLDIYQAEDLKIAFTASKLGLNQQSEKFIRQFQKFAEQDPTIYKHVNLAGYYAFINQNQKSIEHLRLFAEQDNYHYWILLFLEIDPVMENVKDMPEFKKVVKEIDRKFNAYHEEIETSLNKKGLL
jgi:TolB-like protein/class 3 adenylate cyclase/Tfp pilus assembly protein PilF